MSMAKHYSCRKIKDRHSKTIPKVKQLFPYGNMCNFLQKAIVFASILNVLPFNLLFCTYRQGPQG